MSLLSFSTPVKADFVVSPLLIAKRLLYIIFALLLLNIGSLCVHHVLQWNGPLASPFVRLFDLNTESNIPTFFSMFLLVTASLLLMVVATQTAQRHTAHRWWLLSGVFLFLAVDESTMIHEAVTPILDCFRDSNTELGGFLRYIWVVPYVVAFVALALYCAPFIWQLPAHTRKLFVLAGCVFVTGAAGLEVIEGHFDTVYGYNSIYKIILYTVEEVMEMSGVTLFIYALLTYIGATTGGVGLRIHGTPDSPTEHALSSSRLPDVPASKSKNRLVSQTEA